MAKIRPLADRIIVRQTKQQEVTKGGIFLPENSSMESNFTGEVIGVGRGTTLSNGLLAPVDIHLGSVVIFSKYSGVKVEIEGQGEVVILKESEILAEIENDIPEVLTDDQVKKLVASAKETIE